MISSQLLVANYYFLLLLYVDTTMNRKRKNIGFNKSKYKL